MCPPLRPPPPFTYRSSGIKNCTPKRSWNLYLKCKGCFILVVTTCLYLPYIRNWLDVNLIWLQAFPESKLPTSDGVHLSVSYLFAFLYCSWSSQGKNTEVVCLSLLQWTTFCQTSPPWPVCLGWPHTAWLSFIELDKAVVHVIRLASCLWLWFQSVCPLMPSHSAYCLTWFSLTLDVGYLFMAAPQWGTI